LLVQNLLKNVMAEVSTVKDQQEATVLKILKDVKDQAQDSAERAHFLSRYIDEEISKIGTKTSKQVENIKVLAAKLTEQFKKHLINHESMKKDLYKRFEIIESHLPVYRSELYKLMEQTEARTLVKVTELKDSMSNTIVQNFTALDDRVDQFSELVSALPFINNQAHELYRWITTWKRCARRWLTTGRFLSKFSTKARRTAGASTTTWCRTWSG
jgi:uncharacterized protein YicC (UPF0701 family)